MPGTSRRLRAAAVAALAIAAVPLAAAAPASAQGKKAASARIQAFWAGERIDLAVARLSSADRSTTPFWVHNHTGNARTWLMNFRFRGAAAQRYAADALVWSDLGASQAAALRAAQAPAQAAIDAATQALARATAGWQSADRATKLSEARAALALTRQAQASWRQAEQAYEAASAAGTPRFFDLVPTGVTPTATGRATLYEQGGVDRLDVQGDRLKASTRYTVFLTEEAAAPYGRALYVGSFTTGTTGIGAVSLSAAALGAFTVGPEGNLRRDFDTIVVFYGDSKADDDQFRPGTDPGKTPYDADADAGAAVLRAPVPLR